MNERLEVASSISVAILVVTSMIIVGSAPLAAPVTAQSGSAPQVTDTGADQPRTTPEDTGLAITGISVADADNPGPNGTQIVMEAQFTVSGGTVNLSSTNADVTSGTDGSDSVIINGTVAEINDALDGMTFTPEADQNSQVSGYDPGIDITFTDTTNSDSTSYTVDNLAVSAVNDAPAVSGGTGLTVDEGGSASFAAPTASGQGFTQGELGLTEIDNNAQQTIIKVASLPGQGSLSFNGNPVTTGSTLAAEDLDKLAYVHDGSQVTSPATDTFDLTYDDGAGGLLTDQQVTVNLGPDNQKPSVGGTVTVIEGESDVRLDNNGALPTLGGSRGAINITDPEGESITEYTIDSLPTEGTLSNDGNPVSPGDVVTDITQLTYSHNGSEPAPDSFDVSVTDNGGGTGTPATGSGTVTLDIHPNNDDPTLTTNEEQTLSSGSSLTLTNAMLGLTDPDTADDTLTYNVTDVPDPADGYFEVDGQKLDGSATFTQADIDAGNVRYINKNAPPTNTTRADSFSFTVQDGGFRILPDVREGGIYDTDAQDSPLTENTFTVNVTDSVTPDSDPAPSDAPTNTPPTPGGSNTAALLEGETVPLTSSMLDASDNEQSPGEIVYRLESLPASGDIRLNGERLRVGQSFTQAEVNNGNVDFAHGGGEDFVDSFDYTVSDGKATSANQTFDLDVTPQNDAPSAGTDTAFVKEEESVTLTSANIALSDPDNSASDKESAQYAANQDLNFSIDSLPGNGTLTLDGTAVSAGDTVTQAQLNTGELEYTHDGTENFTDNFDISPVDDAGVGSGDATATNASSTGAQANVPIVIYPINDAPNFVSKTDLTSSEAGPVQEGDAVTIGGASSYDIINGVPGSGEPTPDSGAHLSFGDNDSSSTQRQYRITAAPAHGQLLLNGNPVGVGSSFTQADLDNGNIQYEHDGTEGADYGNADSFDYIVSDGDWQANDNQAFAQGTSATPSTYNIDIAQRNDVPELDAPDSLDAFASGAGTTAIPGITVTDLDFDDGLQSNETDFMRVELSVLDNADNPVTAAELDYTAADPSSGLAFDSGKGTDSLIVQGTKTEIDNVLGSLTVAFSADADADDYTIRVTADDRLYDSSGSLTSGANGGPAPDNADGTPINAANNRVTQNITLRASNDNDAPNITNGNTYSVNEDSQVTLNGFTLTDADSFGEDVTATVELYNDSGRTTLVDANTQGSLRLGDTTGLTSSSGDDSNTITLTGSMSDVQAALNDLRFEGAPDYNGPGNGFGELYLRTTFEDFAHADGQKTDVVDNTIEITPVNDQPTLTVPGDQTLDSGTSIAISGFSVADTVDTDQGANDFITVEAAATLGGNPEGTITLTSSGGATVTDNGTATVTVNGTAADVQTTLNSMDYAPSNSNADQTIRMNVTADDRNPAGTGDGNGKEGVGVDGNNTVTDTFDIDVSDTNDGPSVDDPTSQSVAEDESLIFSSDNGNAFTVSDPDDFGADMVANVSVDHGIVTAASGSGADLTGDGSANLTITGTESQINAALDGLEYTPDADFHTDEVAPDTITVRVNDQGNTGTGSALIDTKEADTNVTQVNDRPDAFGGPEDVTATDEHQTGTSETLKTLLDGNYDDSTDNQTEEGGGNTATPLSFVAINGSTNYVDGQGTWQVSDGSGGWINVSKSGLDANSALVVNASREIRFDPAADFHGTPGTLDVRLADGDTIETINESANAGDLKDLSSEGGTGDMGRWSADSVTIQTSVTNENDPPSATGDATLPSVNEDNADPAGETVANLFDGVFDDSTDDQTGIGGNDSSTSLGGIAIVGSDADAGTEGTWQYREDGATGWTTIPQGTNDDSDATLLSNDAELRFVPVPDFNGDPGSLGVRLADKTQTFDASADISGNVTDDSTKDSDIWSGVTNLDTSVSPRNDRPVLGGNGTSATVTESTAPNDGTAPQQLVTGASVSDLDIATTSGVDEFGAGTITVSMNDSGQSFDQLTITDSSLAGIAGVSDGNNGNDLVVNLETTATTGQVNTILEALRYNSNSDTFDGTRDINVTLSDGNNDNDGGNDAGGPSALSDTLAASVTITEQNDPPDGSDGTVSTDEDTTYTVSAADFGYSQPGGETDAIDGVRIDTVPGSGTLELSGNPVSDGDLISQSELTGGDLTYTPPTDQNGAGFTSLTFSVRDDRGAFDTAPNTLTIDVDPVNDAPSASPGPAFTVNEDDGAQTATNFMDSLDPGGGSDESSQTISFSVSDVSDGTSFTAAELFDTQPRFTDSDGSDNTLAFTPSQILADGESETVTVTVGVTDDGGTANGGDDTGTDQTFDITIEGANDAPTALNDTDSTDGDTTINRNAANGVISNDTDPDASDTLEVDQVEGDGGNVGNAIAGDNGGQFTINASGSYEFDPGTDFDDLAENESRDTAITYQVADGNGGTDTATLTVTVDGGNDTPVAADDTDSTTENSIISQVADGVLSNDTDPESDDLSVAQVDGDGANVGNPTAGDNGGQFTINGDGSYSFDPGTDFDDLAENESRDTAITYQVSDGQGGTDTATLTVTVNGVNDAPTTTGLGNQTSDDGEAISVDTSTAFSDADATDTLQYSATGLPPGLSINQNTGEINGTIDFDASTGGPYSVTVTASDFDDSGNPTGTSVDAPFDWTVNNPAPVAANDTDTTDEDTAINRNAANGVIDPNDRDTAPDGDALTVDQVEGASGNVGSAVAGNNGGQFTINGDGSYSFDPNGAFDDLAVGESRTTAVSYRVSDGNGGTDTAVLTVTVTRGNVPPVANNDSFTTAEDTTSGPIDLLSNDTDSDGDTLSIESINGTTLTGSAQSIAVPNGVVNVSNTGELTFTPDAGYNGPVSFDYVVSDGNGGTDTGTVNGLITTVGTAGVSGISRDSDDTLVPNAVVWAEEFDWGANRNVTIMPNTTEAPGTPEYADYLDDADAEFVVTLYNTNTNTELGSDTVTRAGLEEYEFSAFPSISAETQFQLADIVQDPETASYTLEPIPAVDYGQATDYILRGVKLDAPPIGTRSLTGTFSVDPREGETQNVIFPIDIEPANLEVSGVSDQTIDEGENVTVDAIIENTGGNQSATQTVELTVNGSVVASQDVDVASGQTQTVTLEGDTSDLAPGDYSLTVSTDDDSQSATLTVESSSNWWDDYTDDTGVPELDGALDAIDDYESDDLSLDRVLIVIDSYESQTPVPDLIE